ncbi:MAG: NUDIX hydrolase [Granulosicoccus sp.]
MSDGFCTECGEACSREIPEGDNRLRRVCTRCAFVHYENPKNVVGCLLEWQGKVLLCKRAIEPRLGYWTLPAGFMENRESTVEGAAREAFEEATARCDNLRLFAIYNLPRISQVYLMFQGQLSEGFAKASEETLEVGLFEETEIPWQQLAFPVVTETLSRYFEQREQSDQRIYHADIHSRPDQPLEIVRHPCP